MAEHKHLSELRRTDVAYGDDYAAWLQNQITLMQVDRWADVDKEKLLEEVADLGRSDFKGFVSAIEIVLLHMLKCDYQPEKRTNSWVYSILEHRRRIERELSDSPSYKSRTAEAVERAYETAPVVAAKETKLPLTAYPEECPYSWDDILSRPFEIDS